MVRAASSCKLVETMVGSQGWVAYRVSAVPEPRFTAGIDPELPLPSTDTKQVRVCVAVPGCWNAEEHLVMTKFVTME